MMYQESVSASRWMLVPLTPAAIALAVGLFVTLADDSISDGERLVGLIPIVIVIMLIPLLLWSFSRLRVSVSEGDVSGGDVDGGAELRASFGRFATVFPAAEIAAVEVKPYRWIEYGGWGIRWALPLKRHHRAWTVPFVSTGVLVRRTDSSSLYINSREPERLATAIRSISDHPTGGDQR